jgi:hypothetical protein
MISSILGFQITTVGGLHMVQPVHQPYLLKGISPENQQQKARGDYIHQCIALMDDNHLVVMAEEWKRWHVLRNITKNPNIPLYQKQ